MPARIGRPGFEQILAKRSPIPVPTLAATQEGLVLAAGVDGGCVNAKGTKQACMPCAEACAGDCEPTSEDYHDA